MAAPAPAVLPSFAFDDGAKEVLTGSSPGGIYKGMVEHALVTRWNRPEDIDDSAFVAEVKVKVDPSGTITGYDWISGSGNARWDKSVKDALSQTKRLGRPPPKGFPSDFNIRFDVQSLKTENLQLSVQ
jgi:TonB family protein